jgi:hypothetical protein
VAKGTEEEDPVRGPRGVGVGLLVAVRLKRCHLGVGEGGEFEGGRLVKRKPLMRVEG